MAHDLRGVIDHGICPVYQPVVELDSGRIVGYEALARGPHGSPLEFPAPLFDAAREMGWLGELDRACLLAAVRGAEAAKLWAPVTLFVNVEPEVIHEHVGDGGLDFLRALPRRLDVFFEVTERALVQRPAELLETVERLRADGFGIALDDLGAERSSLALLPLLRPDVVKLDMSLLHGHPSRRAGAVLNGVCAYAESTGALILAEGVENEQHLLTAQAMGASLAQGWFFGRPGALPPEPDRTHGPTVTLGLPARSIPESPAHLALRHRTSKVGSKEMLLSITRALESQALELGEHVVVVSAFQHAEFFSEQTRQLYEQLAARTSLTVVLGEAFVTAPAPGVHGASLDPDDPLRQEWDIAVLGPHYAGALVARDLGDDGPDLDRRFEFVLTFDRSLVVDITASVISRLSQPDAGGRRAATPGPGRG